jgi:hypothetical protein
MPPALEFKRERNPAQKTQVVGDPKGAEGRKRVCIMQVKMKRLSYLSEFLNNPEHRIRRRAYRFDNIINNFREFR